MLRHTVLLKWVELEHDSTLGCLHRIVDVYLVNGADEPHPERYASGARSKGVAKEGDSLRRVQLGRCYFFLPDAHGDGGAAGSAQVPHPLHLAPGSPDPTPA